jgi:hypothetical protein
VTLALLFDHLVGTQQDPRRYRHAERFGRFEVDDRLERGRLLDRQIGRLFSFDNAACLDVDLTIGGT